MGLRMDMCRKNSSRHRAPRLCGRCAGPHGITARQGSAGTRRVPATLKRRAAWLLLGVLLWPAAACAQQAELPEFVNIRVGFADQYKAGAWTPVELTLRGGTLPATGRVTVTVHDNDGVPCRVAAQEASCQVLPGQETSVTAYVRFGHRSDSLEATFQVGRETLASKTFEAAGEPDAEHFRDALQSRGLIVHVGRASAGLEEAASLVKTDMREPRAVVARVQDAGWLPTRWYGYEGVDTVVLSTSQPEIYRKLTSNNARVEALDQWVRLGGTLVLSVGSQADEILRGDAPLARFAPGRFASLVSLHQAGALETYASSSIAVPSPVGNEQAGIRAARLADVKGKIDLSEGDLPLVIRTARGFGQVVFIAVDLDRPPLSRWGDRRLLAARLLDLPTSEAPQDEKAVGTQYGFSDLAGQLRSALDQFEGVRLVPFSVVAILVIVYILLIGPGDYFFLRKFVRRMEWTWATFPAIVVLFSVGAYVMAYRLKGDQLRIHQVDLVDVDAAGSARGTTWVNVFSPQKDTFNLALRPHLPDGRTPDHAKSILAWLGLPGEGMAGMYSPRARASGSMLWAGQYAISPGLDEVIGAPIQVWSTKSFSGRWSAASETPLVEAHLADEDRLPVGKVVNRLGFPLSQCMLAYDRWAYELGTLAPNQAAEIGPSTRRTELKTLLTGRKLVFDPTRQAQQEATPYDQSSREASYVLQAMMFFDAAGGQQRTGLTNDYHRFLDMSGLLKAGQAVLVAYPPSGGEHHGAELLRDDRPMGGPQDAHVSIYRFIFAVTARE